MASLDILCSKPHNLKNKTAKIEHKKIFFGPSKILKNISLAKNICLKYVITPTKTLRSPSYILNKRSFIYGKFSILFLKKHEHIVSTAGVPV